MGLPAESPTLTTFVEQVLLPCRAVRFQRRHSSGSAFGSGSLDGLAFKVHSPSAVISRGRTAAAEPMMRPRPQRGERRIDAATDHLAQFGFAKPLIRKVITDLLQLYGGREAWAFLEEGSYRIVLNKLMEEQARQDQKQEAAAAEEASPQNVPPAKGPCYGWISEASETESEPEDGEMFSHSGPVIFTKEEVTK